MQRWRRAAATAAPHPHPVLARCVGRPACPVSAGLLRGRARPPLTSAALAARSVERTNACALVPAALVPGSRARANRRASLEPAHEPARERPRRRAPRAARAAGCWIAQRRQPDQPDQDGCSVLPRSDARTPPELSQHTATRPATALDSAAALSSTQLPSRAPTDPALRASYCHRGERATRAPSPQWARGSRDSNSRDPLRDRDSACITAE